MADEELKWFLFSPACFESLMATDINGFSANGCPAAVISKILGYGIIVGAAGLKIPQILKLLSSQSGKGLSIFSLAIETLAFATTSVYFARNEYPLSTYGEAPLIFIQNVIIFLLIFYYEKQFTLVNIGGLACVFIYFGIGIAGITPMFIIETIFGSQFLLSLGSRLPQIIANFQNKSTGALAMITVSMQVLGCIARLFTTLQEVDDIIPLLQYLLATVLNGIIFAQFFIYPGTSTRADASKNDKKTDGNSKKINKYKE